MKRNTGIWDLLNETMKKFTIRNEILPFTKRNETKRNFAVFWVSRNKRNFAKQFCCFALFRVSRNKKKDAKWKPYAERLIALIKDAKIEKYENFI
jgi:hypothetical protein